MGVQSEHAGPTCVDTLFLSQETHILRGVRLRYRYRLDPSPAQRQALARAFGCARVVYNDGLRLRQDAYRAGQPFIGDTELQHRLLTLAKRTSQRAWLSEVSAVILQQSLADLSRAYRNYFADLKRVKVAKARGEKAKLRFRKPRYKSRNHEQAIRFTANARFRLLPNGRLRLPKIGDLKVRWSRPLPSGPSSVTVSLDAAGRYHASFVLEVAEAPLPAIDRVVGVDLGLSTFATLSDGRRIDNPCWLRQREKALRRSQRNMARKQRGSKNRDRTRRRVAKHHARGGRRPAGLPPAALHPPGPRAPNGVRGNA